MRCTTTVRVIVTVNADDELGSALGPNMVAFSSESTALGPGERRDRRRLTTRLGAIPHITITGCAHITRIGTARATSAIPQPTASPGKAWVASLVP